MQGGRVGSDVPGLACRPARPPAERRSALPAAGASARALALATTSRLRCRSSWGRSGCPARRCAARGCPAPRCANGAEPRQRCVLPMRRHLRLMRAVPSQAHSVRIQHSEGVHPHAAMLPADCCHASRPSCQVPAGAHAAGSTGREPLVCEPPPPAGGQAAVGIHQGEQPAGPK